MIPVCGQTDILYIHIYIHTYIQYINTVIVYTYIMYIGMMIIDNSSDVVVFS